MSEGIKSHEMIPGLKEKIVELASSGKYYVCDRQISHSFSFANRDALFVYNAGCFLLERFFKKENCCMENLPQFVPTKKAIENLEKYSELLKTLDGMSLPHAEEKLSENSELVEAVKFPEMEEAVSSVPVWKSELSPYKYVLMDSARLIEVAEDVASLFEAYTLVHWSFVSYGLGVSSMSLETIENDDYIDLIVKVT